MRLTLLFLIAYTGCCFAQKQDGITVRFLPVYHHQKVSASEETYYHRPKGDSITIETFRCYISNIRLYNDNTLQYTESNSYHLIDAAEPTTLQFKLDAGRTLSFNTIRFDIGIDSTTNTSGVLGGDLDPTKGMYWTWQSGYINFKLSGTSALCPTRNNEFQFHLGGYSFPYNAIQHKTLPVKQSQEIIIEIALDTFIDNIDLSKENTVMTPGGQTLIYAKKLPALFNTISK